MFKFYLKYSFLLKCLNKAIEKSINHHVQKFIEGLQITEEYL